MAKEYSPDVVAQRYNPTYTSCQMFCATSFTSREECVYRSNIDFNRRTDSLNFAGTVRHCNHDLITAVLLTEHVSREEVLHTIESNHLIVSTLSRLTALSSNITRCWQRTLPSYIAFTSWSLSLPTAKDSR